MNVLYKALVRSSKNYYTYVWPLIGEKNKEIEVKKRNHLNT